MLPGKMKENVRSGVMQSKVWGLYLMMTERTTLALTYILRPDLLLLCWSLTSEQWSCQGINLEKRYIKRIDTSNVNLQIKELQCNYAVYIQNPRKEMYMEHGLQCNCRRYNGLGDLLKKE